MKRLLVGGVALVVVVAACTESVDDIIAPPATLTTTSSTVPTTTSSSTTTTTRAPSGPGYGGTAIIADDQFPQTLNPYAPGGDNFIVSIIGQAWLTGVWDIDGYTLERIPEVVTELPTVANGGVVVNPNRTMTVTFHILDEAVWSDGVPISGDDFQFTMDTALAVEKDRELESAYTDAAIISSEAGDKTFSVTLRRPTMKHETLFRWLIPRHAVEGTDFAEDWNTTPWPSGGPFILETFERNEYVTFVRNENYWKTDPETDMQLPYLDRVEFRIIFERESIISAFRAREVDVIQPPPSIRTINGLIGLEPEGAAVEVLAGPVWEHINFQFSDNRLDRSPDSCNDNLSFRRAVMHAIDRDAAADSAFPDFGVAMASYVEAFTPSISTDAWDRYLYDPETAQALYQVAVEETGRECTAVFNTTGNSDMRPRLALLYEEMMEEAGIPFNVQLEDSSIFFGEMLDDATWDIGQWAWVGSPGLAGLIGIHDVFDPKGRPPKGSNYYRWGTPGSSVRDEHTKRFAEIVKEMNTTVDETEIVALIRDAEEILADQAVILPIVQRLVTGAVWADEIGGFKMNPPQASHTWNIEEWYRTDR
jgi:peptide/nickel transport system substrate-binding protein